MIAALHPVRTLVVVISTVAVLGILTGGILTALAAIGAAALAGVLGGIATTMLADCVFDSDEGLGILWLGGVGAAASAIAAAALVVGLA